MRQVPLLLIFFFASILDASYLRSIRIISFPNDSDAQKALSKLKKYVQTQDRLTELQNEYKFEYKIIDIKNYKMIVAEPLRDKALVEELVLELRKKYKSAYPRNIENQEQKEIKLASKTEIKKLKESKVVVVDKNEEVSKIEPIHTMEVVEEKIPQEVEVPKTQELEVPKIQELEVPTTQEPTLEPQVQIKPSKPLIQQKSSEAFDITNYVWQFLFAISTILILVLIKQWISANRKNDNLINKEMIYEEKILQLQNDLKSKDQLVSHVSHELRTPMTAIMGLSHLVLDSDLSKLQRENIKRIEHSAQHLLSLINDILDVSKLQAGKLKIEKSEFNINDIIEYVLNIISIQAKDNNIKLSLDVALDVPSRIVGDSLRLGQVLINILGNAVKFTKDGDISLKVNKLSNFSDSIVLEFSISDTGIGMTDQQVEKIFNSYSQADGSISREYGGTGLGLSITKQLIEMMNGSIKVKSKKDVGTTFTFTIQFKLKDSQNKRQYRLPSSSFLNKRVLVIDRSNQNVIALKKSLEYFNYQVHSIPSFEEAVFDKNMKFDIIVMNENRLSDFAVENINKMRENVKLVILNELYHNINQQVPKDVKIDAYLRSPFTQQSILNMIVELYVVKNTNTKQRKESVKEKLKEMSGKKILVAEDNEVNHKVILGLLSKTGIELTFATDGQAAVDLIQKDIHFDMVLMDINMPIMDGLEATKEIRKNKRYDELPIIALSADVMTDAIKRALEVGMQGHISKPIIVDIFYKKLYDTLNRSNLIVQKDGPQSTLELESNEEYEELSISTGLNRCDKDEEFYKTILEDFKLMYGDSSQKLEELCKEAQFSQARRMAMDIKDVALNIGAYNLCESAANMEYEFEKGSRSNYKKLIEFYDVGLKKLYLDINKYLDKV